MESCQESAVRAKMTAARGGAAEADGGAAVAVATAAAETEVAEVAAVVTAADLAGVPGDLEAESRGDLEAETEEAAVAAETEETEIAVTGIEVEAGTTATGRSPETAAVLGAVAVVVEGGPIPGRRLLKPTKAVLHHLLGRLHLRSSHCPALPPCRRPCHRPCPQPCPVSGRSLAPLLRSSGSSHLPSRHHRSGHRLTRNGNRQWHRFSPLGMAHRR
mmetsp:Transcript_4660/g.10216  ORF Transcript_4660/g.10216 Transcript_4660/m.10216 type:complete len:217 (+) Transcript_4660:2818-3468(+)